METYRRLFGAHSPAAAAVIETLLEEILTPEHLAAVAKRTIELPKAQESALA